MMMLDDHTEGYLAGATRSAETVYLMTENDVHRTPAERLILRAVADRLALDAHNNRLDAEAEARDRGEDVEGTIRAFIADKP